MTFLSPSSFFEPCPRCLWFRHRGIKPPSGDFEGFNLVDKLLTEKMPGQDLLAAGCPGTVIGTQVRVSSGIHQDAVIFGFIDALVDLGADELAVVDFKAGHFKEESMKKYRTQVSLYAYALRHPERGRARDARRGFLGFVAPGAMDYIDGMLVGSWEIKCHEIELMEDEEVKALIAETLRVIELPQVPLPSEACGNCSHTKRTLAMAGGRKYKTLAEKAIEVRQAQLAYYKAKKDDPDKQSLLIRSKSLETELDKLIATYDN